MTLEEKFVQELRNSKEDLWLFYNLFSIFIIEHPNFIRDFILDEFKKYSDSGEWFTRFHKLFRQADMFPDEKIRIVSSLLTDEEKLERSRLINWRLKFRQSKRNLIEQCEDYTEQNKVLREKFPEYKESTIKLKDFNKKISLYKKTEEYIGGHLDSIFHIAICNDDGRLFNFMSTFLKQNHE